MSGRGLKTRRSPLSSYYTLGPPSSTHSLSISLILTFVPQCLSPLLDSATLRAQHPFSLYSYILFILYTRTKYAPLCVVRVYLYYNAWIVLKVLRMIFFSLHCILYIMLLVFDLECTFFFLEKGYSSIFILQQKFRNKNMRLFYSLVPEKNGSPELYSTKSA